jgi:chromosome partitioning protein
MAVIISIINNKGGTGKTTTTLNLAAALGHKKKKCLVIDFDGQCNLSSSLRIAGKLPAIGNVLLGEQKMEEAIIQTNGIHAIAGNENMLEVENKMSLEPGHEYLLKESIDTLNGKVDYILIDCPPNLGILSINSLVAAQYFIVPMQTENFAFIGLDKILQLAEKVKKRLNPQLTMAGILIVRQAHKTKFSQAVLSNLEGNTHLKDKLFTTVIRQDIALMECTAFGQHIFEYAPNSRGAKDYMDLANEIIKKYGKN